MLRSVISLLLTLFLPICALAQTEGVVMSWNVENYFDTKDDKSTQDDEFTPLGAKHWSKTRFNNKRNAIAKTIVSVKEFYGDYPFVVGLVEVENRYVLNELVENTLLSKLGYGYIHRDSHDPRGIECALLYRKGVFIPVEVKNIEVEKVSYNKPLRHILYVKGVVADGRDTLHFFVNHWSSKLGGERESEPHRMASSLKVVSFLDSLANTSSQGGVPKVIIMGDLNDTPYSKPVNALSLSSLPLKILSQDSLLTDKGSIKYKGEWELIDHVIVSQSLGEMMMDIYSPEFLLEEDKSYLSTKPFRSYSGPKYLGGVSDHLPVILYKK